MMTVAQPAMNGRVWEAGGSVFRRSETHFRVGFSVAMVARRQ
jgi:hypothetical protein